MRKYMDKEAFIKNIGEAKNESGLDLSKEEDLSIALMNIISLEEHLLFSFYKTQQAIFLKYLERIRELRKELLAKIVTNKQEDHSETWCISKHLLASSMRLAEVGTKHLHNADAKEAENMFAHAYALYAMFWDINKGAEIRSSRVRDANISAFSRALRKVLNCCKE